MRKHLVVVAFLCAFMYACDGNFCFVNCDGGQMNGPSALPSISPSPSPFPSASPSPTVDPCAAPVTAVKLSGPREVSIGTTFEIDVTPVSASGPLEGELDYCNLKGRTPVVESMSTNLRCSGQCSGYKPSFSAQGVGPFSVRIRVDNASSEFAGTVLK